MTVTGFRQGQRVRTRKDRAPLMQVEGVVETVIVPEKGERFVVMRADDGHCYHRWFHEIEAVEKPDRPNATLAQDPAALSEGHRVHSAGD